MSVNRNWKDRLSSVWVGFLQELFRSNENRIYVIISDIFNCRRCGCSQNCINMISELFTFYFFSWECWMCPHFPPSPALSCLMSCCIFSLPPLPPSSPGLSEQNRADLASSCLLWSNQNDGIVFTLSSCFSQYNISRHFLPTRWSFLFSVQYDAH